jgi:multidrug efflux system outer membrane protein
MTVMMQTSFSRTLGALMLTAALAGCSMAPV